MTPTWSNGVYFVQGMGEAVLNKEQQLGQPNNADADDVSIRAGKWHKYDVQVGRFDVWEVYHLGMGLDLNTLERGGAADSNYPVTLYGATFTVVQGSDLEQEHRQHRLPLVPDELVPGRDARSDGWR